MQDRLKNEYTYTRQHFENDQCLPVVYFRFLKKYRKLDDVVILHYIHFESRDYSHDFIYNLLQARHDVKMAESVIKNPLESLTLKLLANSIYGQFLMEISKYYKYTYILEETLKRMKASQKARLE